MIIEDFSYNNFFKCKRIYVEANPELGFNNPYIIYIPEEIENNTLLVSPVNTGKSPITLEEARKNSLDNANRMNYNIKVACDMKMPLMMPLIARVRGYYTIDLNSKIFNNDISGLRESNLNTKLEDRLSEEELEEIRLVNYNLPKQVLNQFNDCRKKLSNLNIDTDEKFIIEGYSAAGKFSNLLTALSPNYIKACISGGNSGLGIIPSDNIDGNILNYPLGTADIPNFDLEAFASVPQLFYIGDKDYNDPALIKCNFKEDSDGHPITDEEGYLIPIKDEDGNIIPILDDQGNIQPNYPYCYNQEEIILIHKLLGKNLQVRFDNQEKVYKQYGINAQFKKLSGGHTTIFRNKGKNHNSLPENLIEDFISEVLDKNKKR